MESAPTATTATTATTDLASPLLGPAQTIDERIARLEARAQLTNRIAWDVILDEPRQLVVLVAHFADAVSTVRVGRDWDAYVIGGPRLSRDDERELIEQLQAWSDRRAA